MLTNGVDDGNVENCFEFSQETVSKKSAKKTGKVGKEDKSVVNDG